MGKQRLIIKEPGVLAGLRLHEKYLRKFDPSLKMTVFIEDGARVKPGDIAFEVEGSVRSLLQTEAHHAQHNATNEWNSKPPQHAIRTSSKGLRPKFLTPAKPHPA